MVKNDDSFGAISDSVTEISVSSEIKTLLTASAICSAATDFIKTLDDRSKRVITRRFGLDGESAKTLHSIGETEGVTRERIRQIEQSVLKNFRSNKRNSAEFLSARKVQDGLLQLVIFFGGIVREELLWKVLKLSDETSKASLGFLLKCVPGVVEMRESNRFKHFFRGNEHVDYEKIILVAREILKEKKELLSDSNFFQGIRTRFSENIPDHVFHSVLLITHDLIRTPFGQWGIKGWVEATPRGVGDKAYVILKRSKKPMHFLEITKNINNTKFDRRVAHPQTVHNELIRDERFILVGRGIYALKEWGYQSGTVGDVLERIIRKNQSSMLKEDLIDAVLKERIVKRNTILLALQNRKKFVRDAQGKFDVIFRDEVGEQNQKQIINKGETVNEKAENENSLSSPKAEDGNGGVA